MRRSGHPSRPRAITCCFFASLKTLLMSTKAKCLTPKSTSRASFWLAGFQVTLIGRFWVTPEDLKKWIVPRWGSYRLGDVKAVQVEQWLKTVPLARGSKAKIRNIMSALYSHAIRWEWTDKNPITQVPNPTRDDRYPSVRSLSNTLTTVPREIRCRRAKSLEAGSLAPDTNLPSRMALRSSA